MSTPRASLLLLVVGLAPACGGHPTRESHFADQPHALVDLELTAEHAYERALAGDTAAVQTASSRALDDWTQLRGDARRRGGDQDLLGEVDEAVLALGSLAGTSVDPIQLGRAANRITGSLDELFALYDPEVASGVMELDYLGREIILDGKAEDFRHAGTHASLLDERWSALRPALEERGAEQLAKLDDDVAAITAAVLAKDAAAVEAHATALVIRVDDVERAL